MSWSTSTRRARLPSDWAKRRAKVKHRAKGQCQATTHEPECDGMGNECDHIKPGDDHRLSNLQWLSGPCHAAKTQREAQKALSGAREAAKLPRETHPGAMESRPPTPQGYRPPAPPQEDRGR